MDPEFMKRTVARLRPIDGGFDRADVHVVPDDALVDASGGRDVFVIEHVIRA